MSMRTYRNQKGNWVIQFVLSPKPKLKPGQYFVWRDDGLPVLIEADTITGRKSVVVCGGPAIELEVFFEVEVDGTEKVPIVHIDMDPNKLDAAQYEINRR